MLGDQQFNLFAASISQYRTFAFSYVNLSRRFQYAVQGYCQTQFFYGQLGGLFYDPSTRPYHQPRPGDWRRAAIRGGSVSASIPLDRFRRLEVVGRRLDYIDESYNDPALQRLARSTSRQTLRPAGLPQRHDGAARASPSSRRRRSSASSGRWRAARCGWRYEFAPKIGSLLSRQTVDVDARYYLRARRHRRCSRLRIRGFKSWGDFPDFTYFGGNSEMRGYDYLQFVGQNAVFANAELRFPLIEAALTPIGVVGGVRGVVLRRTSAAAGSPGRASSSRTSKRRTVTPIIGYNIDPLTGQSDARLRPDR